MAGRKQMHSETWWATQKPDHVLRCTADLKSGGQCRREARTGTNVCDNHGALAPAVQAAAARRIQMSVDDAVKRLHDMLDDTSVEARDKIKILHDLLDRGGLAATSKLLVGVVTEDPVEKLFQALLASPDALGAPTPAEYVEAPEIAALNRGADVEDLPSEWDDVVDAEVVDEPDDPHTEVVAGTMSDKPPPHIRRDLERLGLLDPIRR